MTPVIQPYLTSYVLYETLLSYNTESIIIFLLRRIKAKTFFVNHFECCKNVETDFMWFKFVEFKIQYLLTVSCEQFDVFLIEEIKFNILSDLEKLFFSSENLFFRMLGEKMLENHNRRRRVLIFGWNKILNRVRETFLNPEKRH